MLRIDSLDATSYKNQYTAGQAELLNLGGGDAGSHSQRLECREPDFPSLFEIVDPRIAMEDVCVDLFRFFPRLACLSR